MKCAVIPCLGLGDGLITLVLSHNLARAGHQVDTYHPIMWQMKPLFPHLSLLPREEGTEFLNQYDRIFFFYEKLPWMQNLIKHALEHFPEKTTILNPISTPHCDYPYWEQGRFDGNLTFVDNLVRYCRNLLELPDPVQTNGIQLGENIVKRRYPNRVILHPTSSRVGKNWSPRKFIAFAKKLKAEGFDPVFILTKKEREGWPPVEAPEFNNLVDLTNFIAESGWMVGNDSGIGHLASCMGIPTLIICRSQMVANFWRPGWGKGEIIIPPGWILNLKGMRLRDKKWQFFIPVKRVNREFSKFRELCVLSD